MARQSSRRGTNRERPGPGRGAGARIPARRGWTLAAGGVALGAALVASYLPSLDGGLQFDDMASVEQRLSIKDLGRFLSSTFWSGLGRGGRVMTDLTFALDYALGRLAPRPYHVTNLLLHLLATLLAFLLGRRLLERAGVARPAPLALAIAALWALHPLNSQAVSYIVQRAEVLASIGYAGAVLLVLEAARRGPTRSGAAMLAAALAAALLGFESKPILVSLPAAVLAALWATGLPARRGTAGSAWPARLGLAAPFALATLWYGTRTISASAGSADMGFQIPGQQAVNYPASQVRVVLSYLRQLLWPDGLALDHLVTPSRGWLEPAVLASGTALLLLAGLATLLAWRTHRTEPSSALAGASRLAVFGLAWWFILLSPTSSVVPLSDLMMDHRPYLASFGIVLGVAALASTALDRWTGARSGRIGLALTLALATAMAIGLHRRNGAWTSPEATWLDVTEKHPTLWRGWQNLAQQEWATGQYRRAIAHLERALALAETPQQRLDSLRNLSANLMAVEELDRAYVALSEADRLGFDHAMVKFNLAIVLTKLDRLDEAEPYARRAIELDPQSVHGHAALAQILGKRGDHAGALREFQTAAALDPDALRPAMNVAAALENLGRRREACVEWSRCAAIAGGAGPAAQERARLGCDRLEAAAP